MGEMLLDLGGFKGPSSHEASKQKILLGLLCSMHALQAGAATPTHHGREAARDLIADFIQPQGIHPPS